MGASQSGFDDLTAASTSVKLLCDPAKACLDPTMNGGVACAQQVPKTGFGGYGVAFVKNAGTLHVLNITNGSPAEGKVLVGDKIVSVEGRAVKDLSDEDLMQLIIKLAGKKVTLGIVRIQRDASSGLNAEKFLTVTLTHRRAYPLNQMPLTAESPYILFSNADTMDSSPSCHDANSSANRDSEYACRSSEWYLGSLPSSRDKPAASQKPLTNSNTALPRGILKRSPDSSTSSSNQSSPPSSIASSSSARSQAMSISSTPYAAYFVEDPDGQDLDLTTLPGLQVQQHFVGCAPKKDGLGLDALESAQPLVARSLSVP